MSSVHDSFKYFQRVVRLICSFLAAADWLPPSSFTVLRMISLVISSSAHYTGTRNYTMLLVHQNLRVVHVSAHVSLREVCDRVKKARILEVISIADRACRDMGIREPRIGVAGLNPHCGEKGLLGREELEEIGPAVEQAVREGVCGRSDSP